MPREHRVGIVLDENFGGDLMLLARRMHVWVVESPTNTQVARDFLELPLSSTDDPLDSGITTFKARGESLWERLAAVAEDVDEHHGEYAHTPAWTVLEIYGLDEPGAHRARLDEYGVTEIKRTELGLEARRSVRGPRRR